MNKIFRYEVPLQSEYFLPLPVGAQILSVAAHRHDRLKFELWARVDPEEIPEVRRLYVVGTGHEVPARTYKFLGTVQTDYGQFVWHIYEGY